MPSRSPEAKARRAERRQQATAVQDPFLSNLVGSPVLLTFLDGKQLIATLVDHDQYTLKVRVALRSSDSEVEALVYKHGVKYIATAGSK